jgi:hypothetical protein
VTPALTFVFAFYLTRLQIPTACLVMVKNLDSCISSAGEAAQMQVLAPNTICMLLTPFASTFLLSLYIHD